MVFRIIIVHKYIPPANAVNILTFVDGIIYLHNNRNQGNLLKFKALSKVRYALQKLHIYSALIF